MNEPIYPKRITKNSIIGVFSPSEPLIERRMIKVRANVSFLRNKGFNFEFGEHYDAHIGYMAGRIEDRISDINQLLKSPKVDLLIASWGGKSSSQLLPFLNFELIRNQRKPIILFSDPTLLGNAIYSKTNLITFCGPNILGKLDESEFSDLSFFSLDSTLDYEILNQQDEQVVINDGIAKGRLIGGNLSTLLLGLMGTDYLPSFDNSIFFWESGNQTPQSLDQLLTLLLNSKKLDKIKGMVIGALDGCKDEKQWKQLNPLEIIKEKFKSFNIPIIQTNAFGHGKRKNPVFPIGSKCLLNTFERKLIILENIFTD